MNQPTCFIQSRFFALSMSIGILSITCPVRAQPLQREWVKTYFNIQTKTNQATSMAVTPDGNIVVAGTSQNIEGDFDYEVIKYKPNGDEVWKTRYASPNQGNDELRAMAVDPFGNLLVTGTSDTVKINAAGAIVWSAPISGRAVIANASYVYVTGFSETDISTAQLENNDVDGRELWRRLADGHDHGIDIGQVVALDAAGNVYVAGQEDYNPCIGGICHKVLAVLSYDPNGAQRWFGHAVNGGSPSFSPTSSVEARSIIIDPDGPVYVYANYANIAAVFTKFDSSGNYLTGTGVPLVFASLGTKMISDRLTTNMFAAGRQRYQDRDVSNTAVVVELSTNAQSRNLWSYLAPDGGWSQASDIAQDSQGIFYVTGYSDNDVNAVTKALIVARLTPSGQQLGFERYNSPNAGSNFGTALAIDRNDNVYVTGYVQNTEGGSEFVTIKYTAAPKIQKQPSGAMHVEFHTGPGQQYAIEATTNFFNWESLITNTADANGLFQFDDTDAPSIPYRFYRGKQP